MSTLALRPDWFIEVETGDISDLDGWTDYVTKRNAYQPPPLLSRTDYETLPPRDRVLRLT